MLLQLEYCYKSRIWFLVFHTHVNHEKQFSGCRLQEPQWQGSESVPAADLAQTDERLEELQARLLGDEVQVVPSAPHAQRDGTAGEPEA